MEKRIRKRISFFQIELLILSIIASDCREKIKALLYHTRWTFCVKNQPRVHTLFVESLKADLVKNRYYNKHRKIVHPLI